MLTEGSRPPVEFIKVCLFRQYYGKGVGYYDFLSSGDLKGFGKRVHFIKRKVNLFRQSLRSVLLGWNFFL